MNLERWIKDFNLHNVTKPHNIEMQKHTHCNATGAFKSRFLNVENKASAKFISPWPPAVCLREKIGTYVGCSLQFFFFFRFEQKMKMQVIEQKTDF